MTKELDEALCKDFPKIFAERNLSEKETCMCWGFPDDGWEKIIRYFCTLAQEHIDNSKGSVQQIVAEQVKEKFGTLRFYYRGGDDYIRGLESYMNLLSSVTCERCGKPGNVDFDRSWVKCKCDSCYEEKV